MLITANAVGTNLVDLIQNVGFPIAVVVYLFYSQREQAKEHKKETDGFIDAINNNTAVINKLVDRLDDLEREIER